MLSGKEYKAARAAAFKRADYQCERELDDCLEWCYGWRFRCEENEDLHAHHLRYPKTRPLRASDLKILCRFHHEQVESQKMHKSRMW